MRVEGRLLLRISTIGVITTTIAVILWPITFPRGVPPGPLDKLGVTTFLVALISGFLWIVAVLCLSGIVIGLLNRNFGLKQKVASAIRRIGKAKLAAFLSTAGSVAVALSWTWMVITGSLAGRGGSIGGFQLGALFLSAATVIGWIICVQLLIAEFKGREPAPAAGRGQRVYRAIGRRLGAAIAVAFVPWFVGSTSYMAMGDWRGFLAMGIPLLLAIPLRAFPYWAEPPSLLNRLLECAFLGGALALSFAHVRFDAQKALGDRIDEYMRTNDLDSIVNESEAAWWSVDKDRVYATLDRAIAHRAKNISTNCAAVGDRSVLRAAHILVWDRDSDVAHAAQHFLERSLHEEYNLKPITVFLVGGKQQEQVGTYSISKQPAFREWVNVCVVQFDHLAGPGTVVSSHAVISLDPVEKRQVKDVPEYGDVGPPVANWIKSLPSL